MRFLINRKFMIVFDNLAFFVAGLEHKLHSSDHPLHFHRLHGSEALRSDRELPDHPQHAPSPRCHQGRAMRSCADPDDKVRARVHPLRRPARAQPAPLNELQGQNITRGTVGSLLLLLVLALAVISMV